MIDPSSLPLHQVDVDLDSRSYRITIGAGLCQHAGEELKRWIAERHVLVITDDHVGPLYLAPLVENLEAFATRVDPLTIAAGERSKSIETCRQLWQQLVEHRADRDSIIVALGGGVVGDIAGFIAATYCRGLDWLQVPTSLLAQVDSSVGGKVGINLPSAKNMVGAFWQPRGVLIDPAVLPTLDQRNYQAGMAEVIKYGWIMDRALLERIEQAVEPLRDRDPEILSAVIADCCRCKADVVIADETERSGRRAILNYGHTYGHAIEAVYGYGTFLHGEAIAIGMTCAARLAVQLGYVDASMLQRQTALLEAFSLPTRCPAEKHDELLQAMKRDKKVARGQLQLILPVGVGEVQRFPAPDDSTILRSLQHDRTD